MALAVSNEGDIDNIFFAVKMSIVLYAISSSGGEAIAHLGKHWKCDTESGSLLLVWERDFVRISPIITNNNNLVD